MRAARVLKAAAYTHGHHASVLSQHGARTAENSAAYLLPHLDRNRHRLLDVGCGPGSITVGLAARVNTAVGVDAVASVLPAAESTPAGLTFQEGDACALDFPDASFDVVHAHQLLQHLPSPPTRALAEMRRVLKPGGILAARDAVYSTMRGAPALPALDRWRRIYMETCRRNRAEPDAGLFLQQWMLEAGFALSDCTYTTSVVTYHYGDEARRRAWGDAWQERAVASDFALHAQRHGLADPAALAALSQGWRAWTDDPAAVWMYTNGEILAVKN
jgi:ubiquinone/menaquinone biosynthesis C-methylase UbiE